MESMIFDYYGYNFKKSETNIYEYQGYTFLPIAVDDNENSLVSLQSIINNVASLFNNDVVYIVKNKYNKYITTSIDNKNICLLTYKNTGNISLKDLLFMHQSFVGKFNYLLNLEQLIVLWDQRLEYIENQCLVNLNFESEAHLKLYKYAIHSFGLAINSLQYMKDIRIDYNRKYITTLTHRRLKTLDKFDFFTPLNFIIDHTSRDLAELYKNDSIDLNTLIYLCQNNNYQIDEYLLVLSRLMFPTVIFDMIEDMETDNIDNILKIYNSIEKYKIQLSKIKEYYLHISSYINIRPIEWINYLL